MHGDDGYRDALGSLMEDFECRCAYCMIHVRCHTDLENGFEVDHFHPRAKGGASNEYGNLYLSCSWCNRWKASEWTFIRYSDDEHGDKRRFADPCAEYDYGVHFVEQDDGRLKPITACGGFHIWHIRLNRESRVNLRTERNAILTKMRRVQSRIRDAKGRGDALGIAEAVEDLRELDSRLRILPPRIRARAKP